MTPSLCPECGGPLPPGTVRGVCPRCLLRRGFELVPDDDESTSSSGSSVHLLFADGSTAPLPFREIGDYELLEQIGHGGMGIIFKARQRRLDRLVAVKLIRSERSAKPDDIARFRTEAGAAARLKHPHIVGIYETGEHEGQVFYSMEFVPGRSLAESMREGPLPPKKAARLVQTVAEAIHFAHEHGVLHRDLKPSNILLDLNEQPHVADFGLAKILQAGSELTLSGTAIGSPHYMPPEQARGRTAETGVRSDVYSLGAILYELLTGRPPFSAATPLETLKLVVEQDPILPRALNPALPRDLETIALKCLAKAPAARYSSAQHLAEELDRFLNGKPILARPVTAAERAWRWCRRNPALAALGVVLAVAPALIISVLLVMGAKLTRERDFTRQNLYAVDIVLAHQALESGNYELAWRSLAAHAPNTLSSSPSTLLAPLATDPRGFEWRWLWERAQGEALLTLAAHSRRVNTVACSSDGRFVASASDDGTIKLWETAPNKMLNNGLSETPIPQRTFSDKELASSTPINVYGATFSKDSRTLLTCSGRAMSAWDVESGRRLWCVQTNRFKEVVFSPTDPNLALVLPQPWSSPWVGLLDVAGGQFTTWSTNRRADALCFAPDGRQLARWNRDPPRGIFIEDFPAGKISAFFDSTNNYGRYVHQMAFTRDGRTLAACDLWHGPIDLFDLEARRPAGQLVGHTARCQTLAISPDGRWLASGGFDQTIRLWDLAMRRELRRWHGHRGAVSSLAFSPDGHRLVSGGYDGTVRFWDVDSSASASPSPITEVFGTYAFSTDGRLLLTQNSDGLATLRELPSRCVLQRWQTPRFQTAVFTTNSGLLTATIGSSNEPPCIYFCSFSAKPDQPSRTNTGNFPFSILHSRSSILASNTILPSPCSAIALSPDVQLTVTGYRDGTVALWETQSGRLLHKSERAFKQSVGYSTRTTFAAVNPLVFARNGKTLAGASFDDVEIKTWALPELRQIGWRYFAAKYEVPLALSPDGRQLAMGGAVEHLGSAVHLWGAALRQPETKLHGHRDHLFVLDYSPDGRTLATGGGDGLLKLWHLPTQREVCTLLALPQGTDFGQLSFSPDGVWLGASDSAGNLHLFHAPPLSELDHVSVVEVGDQQP